MKSKNTARKNDEFLKLRSLQKRDRLNIFVFLLLLSLFYYYNFFLVVFFFFVLHFNKLVNIAYGNVPFATS